jgi:hypothetical protein
VIKFKSKIEIHHSIFGSHYIPVSKKVIEKLGGYKKKRLLCKIGMNENFPCAILPSGDGTGFIILSKEKFKKLKLNFEDDFQVELINDHSEYGMPMPEELQEILNQDPQGKDRFNALLPGKQRNIIYYVSKIKSSNLRVEKAWLFISNLKQLPIGKERVPDILGLK